MILYYKIFEKKTFCCVKEVEHTISRTYYSTTATLLSLIPSFQLVYISKETLSTVQIPSNRAVYKNRSFIPGIMHGFGV